jgi:ABC-type molybdate transport system permease subunit
MSPGVRKFALAAHLTLSVGWIGAVVAYIALDVSAASGQDVQTLRAAYLSMQSIARNVIVPLALASLLTGIVMSLGTKWGLFRHYWVLISLVLTIIATLVLLSETQTISYLADMAADPATSNDELRALPSTLPHSVGGTVVLFVVLVLNIYKPQGLTRYGWRKQHERRVEATRLTRAAGRSDGSIAPSETSSFPAEPTS